jgi:hypothetical protein
MRNPDDWYVARFARELLVDVYEFMRTLPDSERRNYFDQIQRAATSVDNNFGDGAARQSDRTIALPISLQWIRDRADTVPQGLPASGHRRHGSREIVLL